MEPTDVRQQRDRDSADVGCCVKLTWRSPRAKGGDEIQTRVPKPVRLKLDVSVEARPDLDDCPFLRRRVNVS